MAGAMNGDAAIKVGEEEGAEVAEPEKGLERRKSSRGKLRRPDSFHLEAGRIPGISGHGTKVGWEKTLHLAFQSIGVVYGDIGTSPLYVFSSTFSDGIKENGDILGVLSLILYTLILIPLIKYVCIVLWANDNGDGGTFALYSLISRHAKISLIPNQQAEDAMLSNYKLERPSSKLKRAQWIKNKLSGSKVLQVALFLVTILATSMIIGDGVLTPAISGQITIISIVILVFVFSVQHLGTDRVGYSFAPIIVLWFSLIGGIGIYNLAKYDVGVLRAFNPKYIIDYFKRNGKHAWTSLGGVVLCITGALFWPTFIVAIAASIIASQAMISGAFSIIQQSQGLSCFPRVKVVHTSTKYEGQVYIPEINYALMVAIES